MANNFTNVEYADIMFVYGFCNGNSRAAAREYHRRFPNRRTPAHVTFASVFQYSRNHGRFPGSQRNAEPPLQNVDHENIVEMVAVNPSTSTRRIGQVLGIPQSRVWRTLKKEERMHPYHPHSVQRLQPLDEVPRLVFCRWILAHPRTLGRILFTDEAQFTRDGVTNKKNSHLWAHENPRSVVQRHSQHRFSLNVWCGIINDTLIGPHFFAGRLTGEIYLHFLQLILPNLLAEANVNRRGLYFQQDGAPPHFTGQVREHLDNEYPNRWFGRGGPYSWPPRSPDLTVLDYFLWGHMKQEVYKTEVNTIDELRARILVVANEIRNNGQMIHRATQNLQKRCRKCIEVGGGHFENRL